MPSTQRLFCLAAGLIACLPHASPASSVGLGYVGGAHYRELDLKGRLALDNEAIWEAYASYAKIQIGDPGAMILSDQYVMGLDHSVSPALDAAAELSYEYDLTDKIATLGAAVKAYYTFYGERGPGTASTGPSTGDAALDRDIEAALSDAPEAGTGEIGGVFAGLDLRNYNLPLGESSFAFTNPHGKTISTSVKGSSYDLLQLHPSLGFDLPLWDGAVTPSLTGGYYIYSQGSIPVAAQGPLLYGDSLAASRVSTLMTGLLRASWQASLSLKLPLAVGLGADYGQQLLLSPEEWVDIYGLRLSREFFGWVRVDLGARYSVLNGDGQLLGNAGLRFRF